MGLVEPAGCLICLCPAHGRQTVEIGSTGLATSCTNEYTVAGAAQGREVYVLPPLMISEIHRPEGTPLWSAPTRESSMHRVLVVLSGHRSAA